MKTTTNRGFQRKHNTRQSIRHKNKQQTTNYLICNKIQAKENTRSQIQTVQNYRQVAVQNEKINSTMGNIMIRTDLLFFATWKHKHHIKLNVKQRQTNAFSLEAKHKTELRQKGKATTNKRVPEETQHKTEHTAKYRRTNSTHITWM